MMNGKTLRGRVDAFVDVLTDVKEFLENEGEFGATAEKTIKEIQAGCEDLFYMIPLDK